MNNKKTVLGLVILAVAIALGYNYGKRQWADDLKTPVVRTYQVSEGRADEVRNALNSLFWAKEGETGNAQVFGNGLVVVRAPEGFQQGIASLIYEISKQKSSGQKVIHTDYWLVLGSDAKESNESQFPALSTALSAITKASGPKRFRVMEHLSFTSVSGTKVRTKGNIAETKVIATFNDDRINLDAKALTTIGEIDAMSQVSPGEFIVLGQNTLDTNERREDLLKTAGNPSTGVNVYHIVRSDLQK